MAGSLYLSSSNFILSFIPSFSRSQEIRVALLVSVDRSKSQGVSKAAAGVSFLALMISAQTPALSVLCTDFSFLKLCTNVISHFNKLTRGDRGHVIQSVINNVLDLITHQLYSVST